MSTGSNYLLGSSASDPSALPPPPPPPYSATENNNSNNDNGSVTYSNYRTIYGDYKVVLHGKTTQSRTPAYYVESHSSAWSLSNSDLIVRRGSSDLGAELARCNFQHSSMPSAPFNVGIHRTANDKSSIAWTSVLQEMVTAPTHAHWYQYRFNASVQGPNSTTTTSTPKMMKTNRTFIWKDCPSGPMLVDAETRVAAAAFHEHPHSFDKCGVMDVTTKYGSEFAVVALTTYLAIYEKRRRDQKERAKAGRRRWNNAASANSMFMGVFGAGGFPGV